eukprot:139654-Prymnesium_polylepis.1
MLRPQSRSRGLAFGLRQVRGAPTRSGASWGLIDRPACAAAGRPVAHSHRALLREEPRTVLENGNPPLRVLRPG